MNRNTGIYLLLSILLLFFSLSGMVFALDTVEIDYGDPNTAEGYAQTMFDQGYNLYQVGRYDDAVQFFIDSITAKPDFVKAWYWLARTYQETNMVDEAIWAWQKVIQLEPDNAQAQYFLKKMQNWKLYGKEAWEAYEQAQNAYLQGQYTSAIQLFETAIKENPNFDAAYYWLGISQLKNGDYAAATRSLEKYLTLQPQDKNAQYWLNQAKKGQN
ncbi:MAG: hypothetical protein PWP57_964 [Candidatus Atribacteria bacterium]|nr:hypothetical protein [Candidatus Atribacteria bacterium]